MKFKQFLVVGLFLFTACLSLFAVAGDSVILVPDGNPVDIILRNMDHQTGRSIDPVDEFPGDYGYVFVESVVDPHYGYRVDKYMTPDALTLTDAFQIGGVIILSPGTYYFSVRVSTYDADTWLYTGMNWAPFDAGDKDFTLRGAESDRNGPKATIITDQFLHISADPEWNESDPSSWPFAHTPIQRIENIAFDNSEFISFRHGRSSTLIGQIGQADLTMQECTFNGGGITFHTVGNLIFKNNLMEDTMYGVGVASPADANVLITDNQIYSTSTGISLYRNSAGLAGDARSMEIAKNEIQISEGLGIAIDSNFGTPEIQGNEIFIAPSQSNFDVSAGIGVGFSESALVKNNDIFSLKPALPFAGIWVRASSNLEVKSNKIVGTFGYPLYVAPDWYDNSLTSDFNRFIDNNLRKSAAEFGFHILLDYGTSNNVVKGSGVAGNQVSAYDLGTDNDVEGLQ